MLRCDVEAVKRTCLSESMDANPPEWEASPPFWAAALTSSLGRLAKFPGLSLPDMLFGTFGLKDLVEVRVESWLLLVGGVVLIVDVEQLPVKGEVYMLFPSGPGYSLCRQHIVRNHVETS